MEFAIILLTFGLDIILPILGIVGYFAPAYWLLNISFLFIKIKGNLPCGRHLQTPPWSG